MTGTVCKLNRDGGVVSRLSGRSHNRSREFEVSPRTKCPPAALQTPARPPANLLISTTFFSFRFVAWRGCLHWRPHIKSEVVGTPDAMASTCLGGLACGPRVSRTGEWPLGFWIHPMKTLSSSRLCLSVALTALVVLPSSCARATATLAALPGEVKATRRD